MDGSGRLGAEGVALLIAALKEQLGLELEQINGTSQILVVDHVERPSEN